jgi:hypothetical protein
LNVLPGEKLFSAVNDRRGAFFQAISASERFDCLRESEISGLDKQLALGLPKGGTPAARQGRPGDRKRLFCKGNSHGYSREGL